MSGFFLDRIRGLLYLPTPVPIAHGRTVRAFLARSEKTFRQEDSQKERAATEVAAHYFLKKRF
jgi:hypothetical protein